MGNKHGKQKSKVENQPGKPDVSLVSPRTRRRHDRERTVTPSRSRTSHRHNREQDRHTRDQDRHTRERTVSDGEDDYKNVSDEIVLKWTPPSGKKFKVVKYDVEMWDLGLQVSFFVYNLFYLRTLIVIN